MRTLRIAWLLSLTAALIAGINAARAADEKPSEPRPDTSKLLSPAPPAPPVPGNNPAPTRHEKPSEPQPHTSKLLSPAPAAPLTRTQDVNQGRKYRVAVTMEVFNPKAKAHGKGIIWCVFGGWYSSKE